MGPKASADAPSGAGDAAPTAVIVGVRALERGCVRFRFGARRARATGDDARLPPRCARDPAARKLVARRRARRRQAARARGAHGRQRESDASLESKALESPGTLARGERRGGCRRNRRGRDVGKSEGGAGGGRSRAQPEPAPKSRTRRRHAGARSRRRDHRDLLAPRAHSRSAPAGRDGAAFVPRSACARVTERQGAAGRARRR